AYGLPHGNRVGGQREVVRGIVAAASPGYGQARSAKQSSHVVAIRPCGQGGQEARDGISGCVVLADGNENHVIEELALVNVDVIVDPALLEGAVGQSAVAALAQGRQLIDELIGRSCGAEGTHPDTVVRVVPAVRVVMPI